MKKNLKLILVSAGIAVSVLGFGLSYSCHSKRQIKKDEILHRYEQAIDREIRKGQNYSIFVARDLMKNENQYLKDALREKAITLDDLKEVYVEKASRGY